MKLGIVYHKDYLKHDFGPNHPASPEQLALTVKILQEKQIWNDPSVTILSPITATEEDLKSVHDPAFISLIKKYSEIGGSLTVDTPVPIGSFEFAKLAVGGALVAGEAVVKGQVDPSYALTRPGGHHAGITSSSGFCYFNEVAVMVENLKKKYHLKKAMIIDYDVHHGNGTQEIFYEDPNVLYISTHQDPKTLYPGTGFVWEVGSGAGEGFTVNIPLPPRTGHRAYLHAFDNIVVPVAREFKPELIIGYVGADAHFLDPLANLDLKLETYTQVAKRIISLANEMESKLVFFFAGGYNIRVVPQVHLTTIATILNKSVELNEPKTPPKEFPSIIRRVEKLTLEIRENLKPYWKCFKI